MVFHNKWKSINLVFWQNIIRTTVILCSDVFSLQWKAELLKIYNSIPNNGPVSSHLNQYMAAS